MKKCCRYLAVAHVPFMPSNPRQQKLLDVCYMVLLPEAGPPAPIGQHWMEMGMQGDDPKTDIRGNGLLNLLQMARFTTLNPELARRIHRVGCIKQDLGGREPVENYPFALTMFTLTRMVVSSLRLGALNEACCKYDSVESAVDLLFAAVAHAFVTDYETYGRSVDDFSAVSGKLEKACVMRPKQLVKAFRAAHVWHPAPSIEVSAWLRLQEDNINSAVAC